MLELMREDLAVCGRSADALCTALRILKQLRDCEDPTVRFNRLCIPQQFLDDAMITPAHLRAPVAKGQTRAVLDRVLDGVEQLLVHAAPLPRLIQDRGFATHATIVLCRARKLVGRFRHRDPLQQRVGLAGWQRAFCRWLGTLRGLIRY
jgi:phytoene/squalene synthetase